MTEKEYRSAEGVNKSTLWNLTRSPAHYLYSLQNQREDTPAFKFGRAVHSAILTPTAFKRDYLIMPEGMDKRTKAGKAFLESAGEREILSSEDAEKINQMKKAIARCPDAKELLKGSRRERPLFWEDDNGILCKCRIDAYKPGIIIDLKTATDASTEKFSREALNYGYHVQVAHYIDGYQHTQKGPGPEWYFIVIEKEPPYAINILKADKGFIDYGIKIRNRLLKQLMMCNVRNSFPGYGKNDLILPSWAGSGA